MPVALRIFPLAGDTENSIIGTFANSGRVPGSEWN
jgi:hypothetical protein